MRFAMWILLSGAVFLVGAAWAQTETSTPSVTPSPTVTATAFSPEHLNGTSAIGLSGTSLTYRYWMNDSTALDIFLGGNYASNAGLDFSGNNTTTPNWNYSLAVGLKENWKEPVKDVFIQWIERLTFTESYAETIYTTNDNGINYGYEEYYSQSQAFNLYLGLGFEAFIPFWESLSIEGSVGLNTNLNFNQSNTFYNSVFDSNANSQTSTSSFNVGSGSNAFSILSGAVHFYF